MTITPEKLLQEAVAAALDKKATRLTGLDLRGQSDLCDLQLICSGENDRQTRAIADAIDARCRASLGIRPVAIEGRQSGHWILIDYSSVIIHVFLNELRDYYSLETVWPKAVPIEIVPPPTPAVAPAAPR